MFKIFFFTLIIYTTFWYNGRLELITIVDLDQLLPPYISYLASITFLLLNTDYIAILFS